MEGDAVTSILMLLLGAIVALLGSWARAWIDRESAVSNDLYKQRVEALNAIWKTFLPVRTIYARKLPRGHENWLKEKQLEAKAELDKFRAAIDERQVVLPKQVISALRDIDMYLFRVLNMSEQSASVYQNELDALLVNLSAAASSTFAKRTHEIDLEFRT